MNEADIAGREAELERAKHAERLLNEPLLQEALGAIQERQLDCIHKTRLEQKELREEAYLILKAVDTLLGYLRMVLTTGKMAAKQLADAEAAARVGANGGSGQ